MKFHIAISVNACTDVNDNIFMPAILEKAMKSRGLDFELFLFNHSVSKPYDLPNSPYTVYPDSMLEEIHSASHFDAVILSVSPSPNSAEEAPLNTNDFLPEILDLSTASALFACKNNIKLISCLPNVAETCDKRIDALAKSILSRSGFCGFPEVNTKNGIQTGNELFFNELFDFITDGKAPVFTEADFNDILFAFLDAHTQADEVLPENSSENALRDNKNAAPSKTTKIRLALKKITPLRLAYHLFNVIRYYGIKRAVILVVKHLKPKKKEHIITKEDIEKQRSTVFPKDIKFSITVPLYNTPKNFLVDMINSVREQTYGNWELCLADGSDSSHAYVTELVKKFAAADSRIKYRKLEKNEGISENTNACIQMSTGNYIALFDHDDMLHPTALYEYMKVICNENADFIYCDEDKFVSKEKGFYDAIYKPDFAPDNLRGNNYICHFTVFKKSLLESVGMFRSEFDGSQDHDIILRLTEKAENIVHVPKILYHWRVSEASVASDPYAKTYTIKAGINAVSEHLARCGLKGTVESSKFHPNIYRIRYEISDNPLVSIIIPNYNHISELSKCICSIIKKSTYSNFEIIIVENNSNAETLKFYETLILCPKIKVVEYVPENGFNYSKINNYGVQFANGEHIILLNNDIEVITENWIEEMLMFSQRDDVGAVGAMLYYPNDTIQHAGVILGLFGVAGHSHLGIQRGTPGYFGKCAYQQDMSAVTAACMMMRHSVFQEIGGFDEKFAVAFNDIDLCMKIREKGFLIAWTPFAEMYHYESLSRGSEDTPEKKARFGSEVERFQHKWKKQLEAGDPYYNPNLSLVHNDYRKKEN